jgi:hypothetical protein
MTPRLLLATILLLTATTTRAADTPRLFLLDPTLLAQAKSRLTTDRQPALASLKSDADKALQSPVRSVMDKKLTPASGDKHDYMSVAPYFWPDPTKPDGKPYVRKDGQVNPERTNNATDNSAMKDMMADVQTLALAWYFTAHEPYAAHASKLLRTWFLDPATRMNPNLNFGQAIPGVTPGRGIGIIDTVGLIHVVDAIGLLQSSKSWTDADQQVMVAWFDAYLTWLQTSKNGKEEAAAENNHGVWYDAQLASFALFVGKTDLARQTCEAAKTRRITPQIKPDGSQPHELARTNSLSYSLYNLTAFFNLARLAEHVHVDLWHYPTSDAPLLRKALDFLTPYADPNKPWPHEQISAAKREHNELPTHLRRAALAYHASEYEKILQQHTPHDWPTNRTQLLYPASRGAAPE